MQNYIVDNVFLLLKVQLSIAFTEATRKKYPRQKLPQIQVINRFNL